MRSSAILALISLSCAVFQLGWTFEPSRKFFSNALHAPCNESRFRRDIGDKLDVFNCCGERDNITAEDLKIYEKCIEKLKGEKTVNISSANYSCFAECYARNKNWTDDNGFIIAERYLASAKQFYKEVELQALVDKYGPDCVKDGNRVGKKNRLPAIPLQVLLTRVYSYQLIRSVQQSSRRRVRFRDEFAGRVEEINEQSDICDKYFKALSED